MDIKREVLFVAGLVSLGVFVAGGFLVPGWTAESDEAMRASPPDIRGVTFDARERPADEAFSDLRAHGVTHLSVTPFGWQQGHDNPAVHMRPDARWYTEGDDGIAELAVRARAVGLKLIIKPHIWLRRARDASDGEEVWRDAIGFETEEDWAAWEASYTTFMMHYARLAERVGADMLCIGTELATAARARPDFWRGLAGEVRTVYSGRLTYAANWYQEYEDLAFWDAVDVIGVQAYFPVSEKDNPSIDDLMAGWERHFDELEEVRKKFDKPILFTEVGYRSAPHAAARPWEWPSRSDAEVMAPDYELQARLYEAFFRTFWSRTWVDGAIFWKWHPEPHASDERRALDFTPQNKPAAEVLARWFGQNEIKSGS